MSRKREPDVDQVCRIHGQKPTTRQRWVAFHRLWRLATRSHLPAAEECFQILQKDWRWRLLLSSAGDPLPYRSRLPPDVRRKLLEYEKRERERNQRCRVGDRLLAAIFGGTVP